MLPAPAMVKQAMTAIGQMLLKTTEAGNALRKSPLEMMSM